MLTLTLNPSILFNFSVFFDLTLLLLFLPSLTLCHKLFNELLGFSLFLEPEFGLSIFMI
jgi:hypothetical protein